MKEYIDNVLKEKGTMNKESLIIENLNYVEENESDRCIIKGDIDKTI